MKSFIVKGLHRDKALSIAEMTKHQLYYQPRKKKTPPGSYLYHKSVAVVYDDAIETQLGVYIERQKPCISLTPTPIQPCYTICEDSCMIKCGLTEPDLTNPAYVQCLYECQNPPQELSSECDAIRDAMLKDMSPGGQYFDNKKIFCPGLELSVTEPINGFLLYENCDTEYNSDEDLVNIRNSMNFSSFSSAFWDSLRIHWDPSYAEIMLKHHPEYHLLLALCDCADSEANHDF